MGMFRNMWLRTKWALTSSSQKSDLMAEVKKLVTSDPRVKALLAQAEADGVYISFSSKLIGSTAAARHVLSFNPQGQFIHICPYRSNGKMYEAVELAGSLVHELRHYWQYKQLGATPKDGMFVNKSPRLAFIFNRVAEADAYSFESSFLRNVNELGRFSVHEGIDMIQKMHDQGFQKDQVMGVMGGVYTKVMAHLAKASAPVMREKFIELLGGTFLSTYYDRQEVRHQHAWHTGYAVSPDEFKPCGDKALTMGMIKQLTREYLPPMTDAAFERMVLRHAHGDALETISLMEAFTRAVASNDNDKADTLRQQVRQNVRALAS